MNYLATECAVTYSDLPPVLVIGSDPAALARGERSVDAFGLRAVGTCSIETAPGRIEQQSASSAVWIEVSGDPGQQLDALLEVVGREAATGRCPAIVSGPANLLDPLAAGVGEWPVESLIEANEAERAAALSLALAQRGLPQRLSDVAADKNAARLRQLSEEVNRIASTLARLSTGPTVASELPRVPAATEPPPVRAETIRAVIRARRLRGRFFPEDLFADPGWDMLLDLLQAEVSQLRVPVSSLCIAAAVPATTALRWLKTMVSEGIFIRRADPHDGRRVFVELSPDTSNALRRYFAEVGQVVMI